MKIKAVAFETYDSENIHHLFIKYENTITNFTLEVFPYEPSKKNFYSDRIHIKSRYTETLRSRADADSKWTKLIDHADKMAMENGMTLKFYSNFNELLVYASDNTDYMYGFTAKLKDYLGVIPFPYEDPEHYLENLDKVGEKIGKAYHNAIKNKVIYEKGVYPSAYIYIKECNNGHFRIILLNYRSEFTRYSFKPNHAKTKEYNSMAEMEKAWGQIVYRIITDYAKRSLDVSYVKTFPNYTDSADKKSFYYYEDKIILNSIRNYFKEHPDIER